MSRRTEEPEVMGDAAQFTSFYRLNCLLDAAAGATPIPFDGLQEYERSAWADAFEFARRMVREGEGKRYDQLGRELGDAFQCSLSPSSPVAWDDTTPAQQLKWPMLIRHVVELFAWNSDDPNIGETEQNILEVYRSLLPTPQQEVSDVPTE